MQRIFALISSCVVANNGTTPIPVNYICGWFSPHLWVVFTKVKHVFSFVLNNWGSYRVSKPNLRSELICMHLTLWEQIYIIFMQCSKAQEVRLGHIQLSISHFGHANSRRKFKLCREEGGFSALLQRARSNCYGCGPGLTLAGAGSQDRTERCWSQFTAVTFVCSLDFSRL